MSVCRTFPRGLFSPSVHLRPASRVLLYTSSDTTPPSRQPTKNTLTQPRRLAPMPKEIRPAQDHRHQPLKQRQKMKGALASNLAPGSSFKDMAEARIAILENAIASLSMNANGPDDNGKKARHREKKLNAHNAEIQDLRRQIDYGPDEDVKGQVTSANAPPPNAPKGPKSSKMELDDRDDQEVQRREQQRIQSKHRNMELKQSSGFNTESDVKRYQTPRRREQVPVPGWRPGHVDEPVYGSQGTPDNSGRRDEIHAPSAESGGVPEPSNAYIKQALLPPRIAPEPRHILVIIDLNGALIHRPDRKKPTLYIARNSTDLFIEYIFSRFQVMVWSAARPNNVDMMCKQLFPGKSRKNLVAEWGRDKMGLSPQDYNARTQVYKRLKTVWNDRKIQACHPLKDYGGRWDQTNTVLMDDSAEKGRSHPFNLVKVPEFEGQKESEDVLKAVAEYLDDLLVQEDVSAYIEKNPFRFENSRGQHQPQARDQRRREDQDEYGRERR